MIGLLLALLVDAAPAATNADAMFTAARRARSESAYPYYAVYATVVRFRHGTQPVISTWDTVEDLRRRRVHAHSLSREDAAHPHVPHGINFGVNAGPGGLLGPGVLPKVGKVLNHEWASDPLGQITFAVDQDFGLALDAPPIAARPNMSDVASSVTSLPRIGRTGAIARVYEVTDLGDASENGVALHHLGLKPLRDPHRYRLRELWLDAKTSLPASAVVAGIGDRAPMSEISWRVDFAQVQGGTYLARETALAPLATRDGRLDDVTITFEELRPTNRLTPLESLGISGEVGIKDP